MKNILILLILFILPVLSCFSKEEKKYPFVVGESGKLFFTDTIQTDLTGAKMQSVISHWLNTRLHERGLVNLNDSVSGIISCRLVDYLEIEKKKFSIFAVNMRYSLIFQLKDRQCVIVVRNINYLDSEKIGQENILSGDYIPGELVLIEKKYKEAFIENASEKITQKTVDNVECLFKTVRNILK